MVTTTVLLADSRLNWHWGESSGAEKSTSVAMWKDQGHKLIVNCSIGDDGEVCEVPTPIDEVMESRISNVVTSSIMI